MKSKNPEEQVPFTFGDNPAAIRLKEEIGRIKNYRSAVRILNLGLRRLNEIHNSNISTKAYWFNLLHEVISTNLCLSTSDPLIKSLSRNVFNAHYRRKIKNADLH